MLKVSFSRIYNFSAAHRLDSDSLSPEENRAVYDKCNNLYGHGHDYYLELTVTGKPHPQTGMIIPLSELDEKVRPILAQLNYKHLNKEVPFFRTHHSTGEVIVEFLWEKLTVALGENRLLHLKLWETDNNYFEIKKEPNK